MHDMLIKVMTDWHNYLFDCHSRQQFKHLSKQVMKFSSVTKNLNNFRETKITNFEVLKLDTIYITHSLQDENHNKARNTYMSKIKRG